MGAAPPGGVDLVASGETGEGVQELRSALAELVAAARAEEPPRQPFVVLRPTPAIRESFRRHPVWGDAILVLVLASIVAYVANDSGAAAVR